MGIKMNKRIVGSEKESIAADFLLQEGYRILERNFSCRIGEIDLIAKESGYLVFIEVKYRAGTAFGYPAEAVTKAKIIKILKTAKYYMLCNGILQETPCRFDVVNILGEDISVIKNAFDS